MSSNQLRTYLALFAAFLCIASAALGQLTTWPMFMHDCHHSGQGELPWSNRIGKSVPLIDYIMYVSVEY